MKLSLRHSELDPTTGLCRFPENHAVNIHDYTATSPLPLSLPLGRSEPPPSRKSNLLLTFPIAHLPTLPIAQDL